MINQNLKYYLSKNKENLHNELDLAIKLKNSCSYDDKVIGVKLTALTREKIFRLLIDIFKSIHYNHIDKFKQDLITVNKKIRLHIYQLKKLDENNVKENMTYFTDILKVLYSILIFVKS